RPLVHGERAVGVAAARIEGTVAAAPLDELPLFALRAGDAHRLGRFLLDVLAVRVARAPGEGPEPPVLAHERTAAFRTHLASGLGRALAVDRARVLAFRVVPAPDEPAVPAELLHQVSRLAALLGAARAELGEDDLGWSDLVGGSLDGRMERLVERAEHPDPFGL